MTLDPRLPATSLAELIRTRQVSCREVMVETLDRIDRLNPTFNAIISRLDRGDLLAQASAADTEIGGGRYRGWMHGLPQAPKDLAPTRGIRTTRGSPLLADNVPDTDAIFVERVRAAGAILIGKTNTPEFGLGSQTYNPVSGTTRNAYDPGKTCGGSSGGAAVAVALGMLPVADGSDFGGSLRNPAGWANIFGFRPSAGRVPSGPARDLFYAQFGVEGPMARNVKDLAMLLSVMAGHDDRAPLSLHGDPAQFAGPLERDMRGVRIGWLGDLGGVPMEAGMLDLCRRGLWRLETAGCTIEEATLAVDREATWRAFVTLRHGLLASELGPLLRDPNTRAQLKPEAQWEAEGGLGLSAVDFLAASAQRSAVYLAYRALFETYDFLAMPSAQVFPFDAELHWPAMVGGVAMDSYHRWMEIAAGPTLAGCPTVCVPAGFGPSSSEAGGLPSGIQIIGPRDADLAVLQVARAYEQVAQADLAVLPPVLRHA